MRFRDAAGNAVLRMAGNAFAVVGDDAARVPGRVYRWCTGTILGEIYVVVAGTARRHVRHLPVVTLRGVGIVAVMAFRAITDILREHDIGKIMRTDGIAAA